MRGKITKTLVDRAPTPSVGKQTIIWDTELKGFGLRLTPSRKTYVAQSRVRGRLIRVTLGLHGVLTPDEARRKAKSALAEMSGGVDINQEKRRKESTTLNLGEAFSAYKESRKFSPNTLRDYEESMRNGFPDWAALPFSSLTEDMVVKRFEQMSVTSHARTNLKFRFLRSLLNFAAERYPVDEGAGVRAGNPCDVLRRRKMWHRIRPRSSFVNDVALPRVVHALLHRPFDSEHQCAVKDYFAFILLTGCRDQEAASLRWSNVDFEAGTVRIPVTKNGDQHIIHPGPWLLNLLRRRRKVAKSIFVFPATNKYGHVKNHRKALLTIQAESDFVFTPHDLRRTFATLINERLASEVSFLTIKRLLNHREGVTGQYVQITAKQLRAAMVMIEDVVVGGMPDLWSADQLASATGARASEQS